MSERKARDSVGGLYTGLAIVAVGVAMMLQFLLFEGDRLTPLGASLLSVWQGWF